MTINEFYEKYKGKTNLKIAQMDAIEFYYKTHSIDDYFDMLDILRDLHFITPKEYIDLTELEEE